MVIKNGLTFLLLFNTLGLLSQNIKHGLYESQNSKIVIINDSLIDFVYINLGNWDTVRSNFRSSLDTIFVEFKKYDYSFTEIISDCCKTSGILISEGADYFMNQTMDGFIGTNAKDTSIILSSIAYCGFEQYFKISGDKCYSFKFTFYDYLPFDSDRFSKLIIRRNKIKVGNTVYRWIKADEK